MASMRAAAEKTRDDKLDRMGLRVMTASTGAKARGQVYPQDDGTQGVAQGARAAGYETEEANENTLDEKEPKKLRLDRRQAFARGGKVKKGGTTVNVIVAPQQKDAAPAMPPPGGPMPMPPPGAGGPPMMPPPGAGGPPGMPMGRARGGKVPMTAGALSGLGRLEKIKIYGKNAGPVK